MPRAFFILVACAILASLSSGLRAQTLARPVEPRRNVGSEPPPTDQKTGFDFGSYGRVAVGTDLYGHEGFGTNVVSRGSRLELPSYLELNFYYNGLIANDPEKRWRVVVVPAFAAGSLFHYTGEFTSHFTIRNAYAETQNLLARGLRFWAGSRMYRGDDIYLFDYWPMDNLNTVGAGISYDIRKFSVAFHAGLNRTNDLYQHQRLDTPPRGLGPPGSATVLSRPRFVASLKLTQRFGDFPGAKISLYGEVHAVGDGQQIDPTTMRKQALPSDTGWVAGLQLGGWLRPYVFANVWVRVAGGLAAYGELTVPLALDPARKVSDALEVVGALSANYESRWVGVMLGAYVRRFQSPNPASYDAQSYVEGILAVRPVVYFTEHVHAAVELSYQARKADGLDFLANRVLLPSVFRFSLMPLVAPLGRGTYSRPMIYIVYTLSAVNQDARDLQYDPLDYRYGQGVAHFLGAGVEWWFNSSYR